MNKKILKKNLKKKFEKQWIFFIFNSVKSPASRMENVSGQSGFWKFAGLPDGMWCLVEPWGEGQAKI